MQQPTQNNTQQQQHELHFASKMGMAPNLALFKQEQQLHQLLNTTHQEIHDSRINKNQKFTHQRKWQP